MKQFASTMALAEGFDPDAEAARRKAAREPSELLRDTRLANIHNTPPALAQRHLQQVKASLQRKGIRFPTHRQIELEAKTLAR